MEKRLIFNKDNAKYIVDSDQDFHCKDGIISKLDLKKKGLVESTKKELFFVTEPTFIDYLSKIKRGPAIMIAKDIGSIIAHTGVGEGWNIVDAGTGCGVLSSYLARLVGKKGNVTSYEKREDFLKVAEKNIKTLEIQNIILKNKDIYVGIDEKSLDLITLDLPEPWHVLPHAKKSLKSGSFLVCFLPTVTQVKTLAEHIDEKHFLIEKTIETLERPWHVDGLKVRPKNQMLGHSGFLVFIRKL
tara:strand:- start:3765 stop:4493 length:729 start_codon:yes stop_codon:yes gene_type:complete